MRSPPPPPPPSRVDYTAYTRQTRAYEPDDPEIRGKRIQRARLNELERIPAEVRDIYHALLGLMPEQTFSRGFLKEVRSVIQQYTEMDVDIWLHAIRVHARTELRALVPGVSFMAVIGLEPLTEKIVLEVDLRFVYATIDRLLGGRGAAIDAHRPLTDIEQGVFSFLLLKVLALLQRDMERVEQVAVRLEDMRNDLRSCADILRREDYWLVVSWKMNVDLDVGFARAFLPVSLARRIGAPPPPSDSALFARHLQFVRRRLPLIEHLAFEGRVEGGRIEFAREELESLDPGDIVVLEETGLGLDDQGVPAGAVTLSFGAGRYGKLHGVAGNLDGQRVFQVERFEPFTVPDAHDPHALHGAGAPAEALMAEYEHRPDEAAQEEADTGSVHPSEVFDEDYGLDSEDAGGGDGYGESPPQDAAHAEYPDDAGPGAADYGEGEYANADGYVEAGEDYEVVGEGDNLAEMEPLLGDMPVPVVVEMGRVQLSASEVMCLRPGQILELGRSPTDPVDLVVSGRLLAQGELVEIEGQIGVRITRLAGDASS